jgi:hypothetical protein
MIWSISGYKQFQRCQRQWYYKNIVADGRVKNNSLRREVTILSKLQTIEAWRGSVVDSIISRRIVYAINNGYANKKDYYLNEAMKLFNSQLESAVFQVYREPGYTFSDQDDFAAFIENDLDHHIDDNEIEKAREDVVTAISNFLDNKELIDYLKSATYLISQRPLKYKFNKFNIIAVPDLIALFNDRPPHIFDWKVHHFGTQAYDEQLISYAAALYKVNRTSPHKDFPENLSNFKITDYKLSEYQLLHNERMKRDYEVTTEALEDLKNNISSSIIDIYMVGGHKKYDAVKVDNFSTTLYPENCLNCPFKKICKEKNY